MKKPNIRPRPPGLPPPKNKGTDDIDKALVISAEKHLKILFQDPYYYEALQHCLRDQESKLSRSGNLPLGKGSLARKLQNQNKIKKTILGEKGRPKIYLPNVEYLLKGIEACIEQTKDRKKKFLPYWGRALAKEFLSNPTDELIDIYGQRIAYLLRQERKKQKYRMAKTKSKST